MIDKNKDTIFLAIVLPPPKEYLRFFHSVIFYCNLIICYAQEKKHRLCHHLHAQQIVLQGRRKSQLPLAVFPKIDRENVVLDGEVFPASKGFVTDETAGAKLRQDAMPSKSSTGVARNCPRDRVHFMQRGKKLVQSGWRVLQSFLRLFTTTVKVRLYR